jgi:hypothetical protein
MVDVPDEQHACLRFTRFTRGKDSKLSLPDLPVSRYISREETKVRAWQRCKHWRGEWHDRAQVNTIKSTGQENPDLYPMRRNILSNTETTRAKMSSLLPNCQSKCRCSALSPLVLIPVHGLCKLFEVLEQLLLIIFCSFPDTDKRYRQMGTDTDG